MFANIIDPQGLEHRIEWDIAKQEWYGFENIAHGWEPSGRQAVINAVLTALSRNLGPVLVSLPYGFSYAT